MADPGNHWRRILTDSTESEPTKPSKPSSVGFEGSAFAESHKFDEPSDRSTKPLPTVRDSLEFDSAGNKYPEGTLTKQGKFAAACDGENDVALARGSWGGTATGLGLWLSNLDR